MSKDLSRRQFIETLGALGLYAAGVGLLPKVARASHRGDIKLAGQPQNVVILGGGLAGLAAGFELKKAGHTVTILEARKFPGGRVQTIRDFASGQYAEAGALSFPQSHEFTFGYATDFGLPMRPAATFGLDAIANIRNSRFRINSSGGADIPFQL